MSKLPRSQLNFEKAVKTVFGNLGAIGYVVAASKKNEVTYKRDNVEVVIHHGYYSYELDLFVCAFGERYSISEIIRLSNEVISEQFRCPTAMTPKAVIAGLTLLYDYLMEYGERALLGDTQIYSDLAKQRQKWSYEYSLDVLEHQLRPQAAEAFRRGDYTKACQLYSQFEKRLSSSEIRKLQISKARR